MKLLPSLLYPDYSQFSERFAECVVLGKSVHVDFADGEFVPNSLPSIEEVVQLPGEVELEAHFMVQRPNDWIGIALQDYRFLTLNIHAEADVDIVPTASMIKKANRRVGLAIKPSTTIQHVEKYLPYVDQVLVLCVDPGFNGSPFIPENVEKIRSLKAQFPGLLVEADGGMNATTLPLVQDAGADQAEIGSYLHGKEIGESLNKLQGILQQDGS